MNVAPIILKFPRPACPPVDGASRATIWAGRFREAIGRLLRVLRVPGAVADCDIEDAVTGQRVTVCVGASFTRISVDGRDYYFDRITGKLNGTGSAICR